MQRGIFDLFKNIFFQKHNKLKSHSHYTENLKNSGTFIDDLCDIQESNSLLQQGLKNSQNRIGNIITRIETHHKSKKRFIDVYDMGFSEQEIKLIDSNSKLFFKCAPKRVVLVKWIIEEIDKIFERHNNSTINLNNLHSFLRTYFKTNSFNKNNLKKLFSVDSTLGYYDFIKAKDDILKHYCKCIDAKNSDNINKPGLFNQYSKRTSEYHLYETNEKILKNNLTERLIGKLESYYALEHKYISLNDRFSYEEIKIVDKYPKLFFKCAPKRVVLVKWIVVEIEKQFKIQKTPSISLKKLYYMLRLHFRTSAFNISNLKKLFNIDNTLWQNTFIIDRDNLLQEYNKFFKDNENGNNKDKSKTFSTKEIKKIIFKLFPNLSTVNSGDAIQLNETYSFAPEELKIEEILIRVKKELGDQLCLHFLNNPGEAYAQLQILSHLTNIISNYNTIKKAIESIDQSLLLLKVKPLLFAYTTEPATTNEIINIFERENIYLVRDLSKILSGSINKYVSLRLIDFLNYLSDEILLAIKKEFMKVFRTERDKSILKMRANGKTLEEAGQAHSLTRERIRQIESKIIKRFIYYISRSRIHYILQAYSENNTILEMKLINNQLGEFSDIFVYCLKKYNSSEIEWNDTLNGFIIGENKRHRHKQILEYIKSLPDIFDSSKIDLYINDINNILEINVEYSVLKQLILSRYKLYGNVYSKRAIKKTDIYSMVLDRYYPKGIKVYDNFEMMRFRNYVKELFGDIDLPSNNRAIYGRITDITILCGRGKYILPEKAKYDKNVIRAIYKFILDSNRNIFMFTELFERFKGELLKKTNINNHYFLQGVLKQKYGKKFVFTRDTIIKDTKNILDIRVSIENFIKKRRKVVTKGELKKEFAGVTDAVLFSATSNNPDILQWDFNKYLHAEHLKVDTDTKNRLKKMLHNYISKNPISIHKLYKDIYSAENEFLLSNEIYWHYPLFSVFNYLYPNDFEFSRPYITQKGSKGINFSTLLKDYLSGYDKIYISDFKDYVESIKNSNISIRVLIDDISDEFIRVDQDMLIRNNLLNLSDEVIVRIEEITLALIQDKGFLVVKKMEDYFLYPNVRVKWDPFLLVSIVKYYCKRLKVIDITADYRHTHQIIIKKDLNIDSYNQLIYYILKKEHRHIPFKNRIEIENFLIKEGLAKKGIPEFLFDKGHFFENDDGSMAIY